MSGKLTPRRRLLASIAVLALLVSILVGTRAWLPQQRAEAATSAIAFGSPVVVDPVHAYGEPDIRVAPDGNVYDSGPWGTGTQRSIWNRSADGGQTFQPLHSPPLTSADQSDTQVPCPTGVIQCPGGGDTEIAIDHTNKVYYADLAALASLKTATWDDPTKTMQTGLLANPIQNVNGIDRQWFALWDPPARPAGYTGPLPVNYLMYLEALAGTNCPNESCEDASYSTDGITYTAPTETYNIGLDGNAVIDQTTGTVLQAIGYSSTANVGVAILSRDPSQPSNPALVRSRLVKISDVGRHQDIRALFPVITMDSARNAYIVWVTRSTVTSKVDPTAWQIYYSFALASTNWTVWSTPQKVSQAPSLTNVMPWVTAGSRGRIGVVWYGTTDTHNPSTDDVHQPWDVYLSMISHADSDTPVMQQTQVTHHPMHYGTICLEGTGCIASQGNRNLADFFQDTTDPQTGAVIITYDDTSNELTQEHIGAPVEGTADHRGAPVVMSVTQTGGVGLFGTRVTGRTRTKDYLDDNRTDDAAWDPLYGNNNIPQLDLLREQVQGAGDNVEFTFHMSDLDNLQNAFDQTGAQALDYVMRWTGPAIQDPQTGTRNPIYYVEVEVTSDLTFHAYAGQAISVELCSVSGCFPHIIDYPAPPRGGTEVPVRLVHVQNPFPHEHWVVDVPRTVLDGLQDGQTLESFGAYTFVRNHSATVPYTNTEAEAGIVPIEIDGICCIDATLQP